ncbi:MAG: hypothetical protein KJS45_03675 [Bacteroidetes bacterium]|nr:hypothetical protein [Bacteroidota bacterium]
MYGTIWVSLLSLIPIFCELDITALNSIKNKFEYGTFGDYIGGVLGTIIAAATLWIVRSSFKQVNEQSMQQSIAILLQSYQHTIEDYDYTDSHKHPTTQSGREGIKEFLNQKIKVNINDMKACIEDPKIPLHKILIEDFPTHIPAIIVSIIHTIDKSDINNEKKEDMRKSIKTMLSYEERILLLLYLFEKIIKEDKDDFKTDYDLVTKLLGDLETKVLGDLDNSKKTYFSDYEELIAILKEVRDKPNNQEPAQKSQIT